MTPLYKWAGGRKFGLYLLSLAVVTGMAVYLQADFSTYATAVGGMLAWTTGAGVYEDVKRPTPTQDPS